MENNRKPTSLHLLRPLAAMLLWLLLTATTATAQQQHSDALDNVLEYTPYAALLTMKACGLDSRDDWPRLAAQTAAAWVVANGVTFVMKRTVRHWRPDHSDRHSFPSGHATTVFAGATLLHKEFGHLSPWVTIGGYAVATLTAADRVRLKRHHWYDVCAGAAIGVAATHLTYYVADQLFPRRNVTLAFTGQQVDVAIRW